MSQAPDAPASAPTDKPARNPVDEILPVGRLINADLLVADLVTMLQALGIGKILGVRLPDFAGATCTAVTPMILIAGEYGMQAVYGR